MKRMTISLGVLCLVAAVQSAASAAPPLKALIVDGQNNHGVWPKTTVLMKNYLEETGLFAVDVATQSEGPGQSIAHPRSHTTHRAVSL